GRDLEYHIMELVKEIPQEELETMKCNGWRLVDFLMEEFIEYKLETVDPIKSQEMAGNIIRMLRYKEIITCGATNYLLDRKKALSTRGNPFKNGGLLSLFERTKSDLLVLSKEKLKINPKTRQVTRIRTQVSLASLLLNYKGFCEDTIEPRVVFKINETIPNFLGSDYNQFEEKDRHIAVKRIMTTERFLKGLASKSPKREESVRCCLSFFLSLAGTAEGVHYLCSWIGRIIHGIANKTYSKNKVALVLVSEEKAVGKGLFSLLVRTLVGLKYSHESQKADNVLGKFNSIAKNKIVSVFGEFRQSRDSIDALNNYITGDVHEVTARGSDASITPNVANTIITSNRVGELKGLVDGDDRRYSLFNVSKMTYSWKKGDGRFKIMDRLIKKDEHFIKDFGLYLQHLYGNLTEEEKSNIENSAFNNSFFRNKQRVDINIGFIIEEGCELLNVKSLGYIVSAKINEYVTKELSQAGDMMATQKPVAKDVSLFLAKMGLMSSLRIMVNGNRMTVCYDPSRFSEDQIRSIIIKP
ncbi:MAG: hypothetical protein JJW01_00635, partial [Alphaproteobacteria bacterium]|nr:hypothetical protein [Rickettsiales bacterium]